MSSSSNSPTHWEIKDTGGGNLTATNTETGEVISGTAATVKASITALSTSLPNTCVSSRKASLKDLAPNTIKCNSASAINITVSPDSQIKWPDDAQLTTFQVGAGAAGFTAGTGVTILGTPTTAAQNVFSRLTRVGANTWAYNK